MIYTVTEFKKNAKSALDLVLAGKIVIIQRGKRYFVVKETEIKPEEKS